MRVCRIHKAPFILSFFGQALNNSSDDRREEDVFLSEAKNLDNILNVSEILRYALDDKML